MTADTIQDYSALEVSGWLNSLPRTSARPVLVRIGRKQYPGAFYTQERDHHPGTPAYARGERTYRHTMLYLVGDFPASSNGRNVAYRFEGSSRRWYLAAYYQAPRSAGRTGYHPFGRMIQLAPDDGAVPVTVSDRTGEPYPERTIRLERC